MFRICIYNEPILREKGVKVKDHQDIKFRELANKMVEHLVADDNGIGLAAQQVGHALQLCIVDLKDSPKYVEEKIVATLDGKKIPVELMCPLVITNPVITPIGEELDMAKEPCMSLPGMVVPVKRPNKIKLEYQDIDGNSHELLCNSLLSKCIQHEVDHLFGILTIDRTDPRALNSINSKLKRLKRETRDFMKTNEPKYFTYK